jgi:tripartite-type tricarboxylate transporter receptor subunit TctC
MSRASIWGIGVSYFTATYSNIRASYGAANALCQKPDKTARVETGRHGDGIMKPASGRVTAALAAGTIAAALALAILPAWPQAYPSRPIHLIVGFAPGGTGDILGRIIGNQLGIELNQSVIVENRAGAGGTIGTHDVVNAPPDGYMLNVGQTPEIAINPYFMKGVGYDALKDLQPIALAGVVPLALVVPATSPFSTVADWVKALREVKPLNFASAGVGTPGHIAGELLKLKLDSKLIHVPYKGAGPAMNDVAGGQVDFYFPGFPAAVPLAQGGKVKLLAVSSAKRSSIAPDAPTVAEASGLDFDFTLWVGFFAPRGTPMELATRLNATINKIIAEPDIKAKLQQNGAEVTPLSIDQFTGFMRGEIAKYQGIIKAADIKPE